jgi:hypothetical protein
MAQKSEEFDCVLDEIKGIVGVHAWQLLTLYNAELNPICPLLALFGAHHIFHVSR